MMTASSAHSSGHLPHVPEDHLSRYREVGPFWPTKQNDAIALFHHRRVQGPCCEIEVVGHENCADASRYAFQVAIGRTNESFRPHIGTRARRT
jgi:hypothetical protein